MSNRRSFKSDTSFLEKISIGAIGTKQVFASMVNQGHRPIELERGSMSFKIWKQIKIKRIRVPDILCVNCSTRIESRAKTSFEISMSHSVSDPDRAWDNGLKDEDYVAFPVCSRSGPAPIAWKADKLVQFTSIEDLRSAQRRGNVVVTEAKGAQEGFEKRIVWPTAASKASGVIAEVTKTRLQYRRNSDGRLITLRLSKGKKALRPLLKTGDSIVQNQVLASVVDVKTEIPCSKSASDIFYIDALSSKTLSERYAASKALSYFPSKRAFNSLALKVNDPEEHVYVRLEAAASLARHSMSDGWRFIEERLSDDFLQNRLEAVIILGEIDDKQSVESLSRVLDGVDQHPEIRAGAAWALGELKNKAALGVLIKSFNAVEQDVRIEAARALSKLAQEYSLEVVSEFPKSRENERAGLAWALTKAGKITLDDVLKLLVDEDARRWAAYIVGMQEPGKYLDAIERLKAKDPELYFAVTVLWKIISSWTYNLEEY